MQYKFILFCFVGLSGLVIDFGITWFLKERIKINKYVANAIGFIVAATSNFYLNKKITFENINPDFVSQYFKFILVSTAGLAINTFLIYLMHSKWKYKFYISKLIAICIVVLWNYSMSLLLVFGKTR